MRIRAKKEKTNENKREKMGVTEIEEVKEQRNKNWSKKEKNNEAKEWNDEGRAETTHVRYSHDYSKFVFTGKIKVKIK
jgi:hypothetical protein